MKVVIFLKEQLLMGDCLSQQWILRLEPVAEDDEIRHGVLSSNQQAVIDMKPFLLSLMEQNKDNYDLRTSSIVLPQLFDVSELLKGVEFHVEWTVKAGTAGPQPPFVAPPVTYHSLSMTTMNASGHPVIEAPPLPKQQEIAVQPASLRFMGDISLEQGSHHQKIDENQSALEDAGDLEQERMNDTQQVTIDSKATLDADEGSEEAVLGGQSTEDTDAPFEGDDSPRDSPILTTESIIDDHLPEQNETELHVEPVESSDATKDHLPERSDEVEAEEAMSTHSEEALSQDGEESTINAEERMSPDSDGENISDAVSNVTTNSLGATNNQNVPLPLTVDLLESSELLVNKQLRGQNVVFFLGSSADVTDLILSRSDDFASCFQGHQQCSIVLKSLQFKNYYHNDPHEPHPIIFDSLRLRSYRLEESVEKMDPTQVTFKTSGNEVLMLTEYSRFHIPISMRMHRGSFHVGELLATFYCKNHDKDLSVTGSKKFAIINRSNIRIHTSLPDHVTMISFSLEENELRLAIPLVTRINTDIDHPLSLLFRIDKQFNAQLAKCLEIISVTPLSWNPKETQKTCSLVVTLRVIPEALPRLREMLTDGQITSIRLVGPLGIGQVPPAVEVPIFVWFNTTTWTEVPIMAFLHDPRSVIAPVPIPMQEVVPNANQQQDLPPFDHLHSWLEFFRDFFDSHGSSMAESTEFYFKYDAWAGLHYKTDNLAITYIFKGNSPMARLRVRQLAHVLQERAELRQYWEDTRENMSERSKNRLIDSIRAFFKQSVNAMQ